MLGNAVNGWRRAAIALLAALVLVPTAGASSYDPATDAYSMAALTTQIGATAWWNAGYTGSGVTVAVIDTGVAPVAGLDGAGKLFTGPDLSLESQAPNLTRLDTYGHGTFVAGVIAGHDSSLTAPYASAPASAYRGVAPDAKILSIKVATADGGADVSQVIAAIYWVIQHKTDNGMNIRVINLAYGTNSRQAYTVDPLAFAAQLAWKKGIVVVAAAGNVAYQQGNSATGLADPAYNPYVIAVGGYDSMGTAATGDDAMAPYSAASTGCSSCKSPDFVTVGSHVQGLRVPNSWIDVNHPEGQLGTRYFRGSGTSFAAAVTSGAVALILQKYPTLTPDQVKRFITANARSLGAASTLQGAGALDLAAMLTKTPAAFTQSFTNGTGTGSIEMARGSDHLVKDNVTLTGEKDIFGKSFSGSLIAAKANSSGTWSGGTWNSSAWSGNSWSGNSWSGNSWSGNSWSGNSWSSGFWSGNSWSGNSWSGNSWSGNSWSGNSWSSGVWAGGSWLGATWD